MLVHIESYCSRGVVKGLLSLGRSGITILLFSSMVHCLLLLLHLFSKLVTCLLLAIKRDSLDSSY